MSRRFDTELSVTPQEVAHRTFIEITDRKSLNGHIKNLVNVAQEFHADDLKKRRLELKQLLAYEDKIYEDEFANKVKMRIDEDIQKRKNKLYEIKEESSRAAQQFLNRKRIQQNMESCYEIREMLRAKETQNVKETHLEQMLEKERELKRQHELDKYWLNVGKINSEKDKNLQLQENCLKRQLALNNKRFLEIQLQDQQELKRKLCEERAKEAEKISKLMREMRLEEFDRKRAVKGEKMLQYRQDLLKMMKEDDQRRCNERREAAEEHLALIEAIQAAEKEERLQNSQRKKDTYKAIVEFINYSKRMRELESQQEKMRNERADDLSRVDICTKRNLQLEADRRAEKAHACYCELRKQVCEEAERRLREKAQQRENKILENLFVHEEIPRSQILEQRKIYRQELDKQIVALKKIREEENERFRKEVMSASNDPELCEKFAAQYLAEGTDFLEPHTNWYLLMCPQPKSYAVDLPSYKKEGGSGGGGGDHVKPEKCAKCLGCDGKHKFNCSFSLPRNY